MTFITIKDFDIVELEIRWSEGDKFAFIEAIAYCAARNRPYPDWVRAQIDKAMTAVFEATFPNVDFKSNMPSLVNSPILAGLSEQTLKERFNPAADEAIKTLCLKLDRKHIISTRKRAIRNRYLAELVADFADLRLEPKPHFANVTRVKEDLKKALYLSKNEWSEAWKDENFILEHKINGKDLRIRRVPPECRMASFDVIDNAWHKHKGWLLDLHVQNKEAIFGVNLSG